MRLSKYVCICFLAAFLVNSADLRGAGEVTATLDVDAWIDAGTRLRVYPNSTGTGTDIVWHKNSNCGAPGRWGGNAYDTGLASSLGGSASWMPAYIGTGPSPWGEAVSYPCTDLPPASNFYDPTGQYNDIVQVGWQGGSRRSGSGVYIEQQPKPSNGFYMRAVFYDSGAGASWIMPRFTYPAKAVLDYEWIAGSDDFNTWQNWSSHRVPGANHTAVFNSGQSAYDVNMGGATVGGIRVHDRLVTLGPSMTVNDSIEVQPMSNLLLVDVNDAPSKVTVRAGAGLSLRNSALIVDELNVSGFHSVLHVKEGYMSVAGEASMHHAKLFLSAGSLHFQNNSTLSGTISEIYIGDDATSYSPGDSVSVITYGANVQRSSLTSRSVEIDYQISGDGYWEARSLFTNGYITAVADPGPQNDSDSIASNKLQVSLLGGAQTDSGADVSFTEVTLDGDLSVEQTWVELGQYDGLPFDSIDFFAGGTVLQLWELGFDGQFNGSADVTLNFHEEFLTPGLDMQDLSIYHYENGAWTALDGIIDELNCTIQFQTESFSPFALGTEVPEPCSLILLGAGAAGLLGRSRRRRSPR